MSGHRPGSILRVILGLLIFTGIFFLLSSCGKQGMKVYPDGDVHSLGARFPTPVEQEYLRGKVIRITDVLPNDISRKRKAIETGKAGRSEPAMKSSSGLPSAVDNGSDGYIPPVKSQGTQGSCAAFSTSYYYKTYQEAKERNWSPDIPGRQMSPAFTYNLINGGSDNGGWPTVAMQVIVEKGNGTWADMPYNQDNWTDWPSENTWRNALQYRAQYAGEFSTNGDEGINNLKQWLANGDLAIICFSVYTSFDHYDGGTNHEYKYDNGVIYGNSGSCRGGHAVTVIGYDDNKAYNDGTETRYGAFKLVNSWGTGWGNNGYFWFSYDYVKEHTWGVACVMCDRTSYQANVIGIFGVSHPGRGELNIEMGVGNPDSPTWSKTFFNNIGGTSNAISSSDKIVVDLTDGWDHFQPGTAQNYFLKVADDSGGGVGTIDYMAIEYKELSTSTEVPVNTVDGESVSVNLSKVLDKTDRTITLTSPASGETWSGNRVITWTTAGEDWVQGDQVLLEFSSDSGCKWIPLGITDYNTAGLRGGYTWDTTQVPNTSTARIRVSYLDVQQINDSGTGDFTINNSGNRAITITSPAEGIIWGGTRDITWELSGTWEANDTLKIEYSPDDGASWETVTTGQLAHAGSYSWNLSGLPSGNNYRVRLTYELNSSVFAISPKFSVNSVEIITETLPDAYRGVGYNSTIQLNGGVAPYNFSVIENKYFETSQAQQFNGGGIPQNWKADDNSWTYNLPFSFPFAGENYSSLEVSSNGYLELGDGNASDYENTRQKLIDNVRIAPLWDDIRTNGSALEGEDIYITEFPDHVIIRWVGETYLGNHPVNFEAILYSDGNIKFNYGTGNNPVSPTIGISAGNGEHYVLSIHNGQSNLDSVNSVSYYFSRGLPDGLFINESTGVISGTPDT
ncbi:MAG: putative Ig domain-containing protein, partial [Candidatus Eremiobacteraeota bacterium]|nr:putative Ig domain-containing protein [Candidatus Eremiobacteraeota bacterium]